MSGNARLETARRGESRDRLETMTKVIAFLLFIFEDNTFKALNTLLYAQIDDLKNFTSKINF